MVRTAIRSAALMLLAAGLSLSWVTAEEKDKGKAQLLDPDAFVKKASFINQDEIAAGKLAMERSTREDVKRYGNHLAQDHKKADQELTQLAAKNKWVVAGAPDLKHQALAEKLARLPAAEFDKEFLNHMIMGHKEAIRLFEAQAKDAKNPDVKAFAEKTLPTLREHLKEAEKLQEKSKVNK